MKKHIIVASVGVLAAAGSLGAAAYHYQKLPKVQPEPTVPLTAYNETVNGLKTQLSQAQQSAAGWQSAASKALAQRQQLCAFDAKYHIRGVDPSLCQ